MFIFTGGDVGYIHFVVNRTRYFIVNIWSIFELQNIDAKYLLIPNWENLK